MGRKPRPDYFSKALALQFVDASTPVRQDVVVTFLVDGKASAAVEDVMLGLGDIRRGRWSSAHGSCAEQLRLARTLPAQVVWFAEDDYLYAADALSPLVGASAGSRP